MKRKQNTFPHYSKNTSRYDRVIDIGGKVYNLIALCYYYLMVIRNWLGDVIR